MTFEAVLEWNPWWATGQVPEALKGFGREDTKKLEEVLRLRHIKILAGARRAGKSTILYQIVGRLIESGIDPKSILYLNFEDENLLDLDFDKIMESYMQKFDTKEIYLFVDEIQNRDKWEFWIKTSYDLRKFKQIFISGSSSLLLSSDYATLLTGRELTFVIYPLSFREVLAFRGVGIEPGLATKEKKAKIKRSLEEYIRYGGFPEVVLEEAKKREILSEYYSAILERDVIYRHKLEADKVRVLGKYLLSNVSRPHSFRSLANVSGLSPTTVSSYLSHIGGSFLIFENPIFSYKIKDQLHYPRKIYCIDTGLRNAVSFSFSADLGRLAENIAFIELKRRKKEIVYWKDDKGEVDFVIKDGLKPKSIIQVCYGFLEPDIKERETSALARCAMEFSLKEGLVLTEDTEGDTTIGGVKIKYVPLWKWLLE